MFGLGFPELVVLAILGLILLGPEQLPEVARTLGRFVNDLKRSADDLTSEFKKQGLDRTTLDELRQEMLPPSPPLNDGDFGHKEPTTEEAQTDGTKPKPH